MRILSIDFGTVRIGTALSDELGLFASPLVVIPNTPSAVDDVARLVAEHRAERVVLGMPYALDGTQTEMTRLVKAFAQRLAPMLPCPIIEWDEAFSSRAAAEGMRGAGMRKKKRAAKGTADTWAAAIILQGYLESLR